METTNSVTVCKACGVAGAGKYCANCGQVLAVKRISLPELLHEAFHFITHLDKGFFYTLKMLVVSPGKVQRQYVEGNRVKHQKPFSMFFISGTASALLYYWIGNALSKYFHWGDEQTAHFFHQYFVLLHACLLPLYSLIAYLCFKKSGYNYGEIGVYQLYNFSFIFLLVGLIQLLKFIKPDLETRYIEFPLIVVYILLTNLNFFVQLKKSTVVVLTFMSITFIFLLAALVQDKVITLIH